MIHTKHGDDNKPWKGRIKLLTNSTVPREKIGALEGTTTVVILKTSSKSNSSSDVNRNTKTTTCLQTSTTSSPEKQDVASNGKEVKKQRRRKATSGTSHTTARGRPKVRDVAQNRNFDKARVKVDGFPIRIQLKPRERRSRGSKPDGKVAKCDKLEKAKIIKSLQNAVSKLQIPAGKTAAKPEDEIHNPFPFSTPCAPDGNIYRYSCMSCSVVSYATYLELRKHEDWCGQVIGNPQPSENPQPANFDATQPLTCHICGLKFRSLILQSRHVSGTHRYGISTESWLLRKNPLNFSTIFAPDSSEFPHVCQSCAVVSFADTANLRRHEDWCGLSSTGLAAGFKCPKCPRLFRQQEVLDRHQSSCGSAKNAAHSLTTSTSKQITLQDICAQAFTSAKTTSIDPNRASAPSDAAADCPEIHSCPVCDLSLSSLSELLKHFGIAHRIFAGSVVEGEHGMPSRTAAALRAMALKVRCLDCLESFSSRLELHQHKRKCRVSNVKGGDSFAHRLAKMNAAENKLSVAAVSAESHDRKFDRSAGALLGMQGGLLFSPDSNTGSSESSQVADGQKADKLVHKITQLVEAAAAGNGTDKASDVAAPTTNSQQIVLNTEQLRQLFDKCNGKSMSLIRTTLPSGKKVIVMKAKGGALDFARSKITALQGQVIPVVDGNAGEKASTDRESGSGTSLSTATASTSSVSVVKQLHEKQAKAGCSAAEMSVAMSLPSGKAYETSVVSKNSTTVPTLCHTAVDSLKKSTTTARSSSQKTTVKKNESKLDKDLRRNSSDVESKAVVVSNVTQQNRLPESAANDQVSGNEKPEKSEPDINTRSCSDRSAQKRRQMLVDADEIPRKKPATCTLESEVDEESNGEQSANNTSQGSLLGALNLISTRSKDLLNAAKPSHGYRTRSVGHQPAVQKSRLPVRFQVKTEHGGGKGLIGNQMVTRNKSASKLVNSGERSSTSETNRTAGRRQRSTTRFTAPKTTVSIPAGMKRKGATDDIARKTVGQKRELSIKVLRTVEPVDANTVKCVACGMILRTIQQITGHSCHNL